MLKVNRLEIDDPPTSKFEQVPIIQLCQEVMWLCVFSENCKPKVWISFKDRRFSWASSWSLPSKGQSSREWLLA